jgi:hypothetical protein
MTGSEDALHLDAPKVIETTGSEDGNQAIPVDGVRGFPEINLEDNGRVFPYVATLDKVGIVGDMPKRQ